MGMRVVKIPKMPNLEPDAKLMHDLGAVVLMGIEERTEKGVDKDGKKFKPYTPSYRKTRAKKGRTKTVNLEFNGQMLGNMTQKTENGVASIYFPDSHEALKARVHTIGEGKMPARKFFGVSKADSDKVFSLITNFFRKKLGS